MEFEDKDSNITVISPPPAPPLPPPPTINYPLIINRKKSLDAAENQPPHRDQDKPLFNQKLFMEKYSDKYSLVSNSKSLFDEWKSYSDSHQMIKR